MPNPKEGTVTKNIADAISKAKKGQIRYKNDKAGIIHAIIGKLDLKQINSPIMLLRLLLI